VGFLSKLSSRHNGKQQYAEYLSKFYVFCKQRGMVEIPDYNFEKRTARQLAGLSRRRKNCEYDNLGNI